MRGASHTPTGVYSANDVAASSLTEVANSPIAWNHQCQAQPGARPLVPERAPRRAGPRGTGAARFHPSPPPGLPGRRGGAPSPGDDRVAHNAGRADHTMRGGGLRKPCGPVGLENQQLPIPRVDGLSTAGRGTTQMMLRSPGATPTLNGPGDCDTAQRMRAFCDRVCVPPESARRTRRGVQQARHRAASKFTDRSPCDLWSAVRRRVYVRDREPLRTHDVAPLPVALRHGWRGDGLLSIGR